MIEIHPSGAMQINPDGVVLHADHETIYLQAQVFLSRQGLDPEMADSLSTVVQFQRREYPLNGWRTPNYPSYVSIHNRHRSHHASYQNGKLTIQARGTDGRSILSGPENDSQPSFRSLWEIEASPNFREISRIRVQYLEQRPGRPDALTEVLCSQTMM